MPDTISHYRQARLILQIPPNSGTRTYYSLHLVGVRKGIPTSTIVLDGAVANLAQDCTVEEVLEAIAAAVAQSQLH